MMKIKFTSVLGRILKMMLMHLSKFAMILFAPLFHVKSDVGDLTVKINKIPKLFYKQSRVWVTLLYLSIWPYFNHNLIVSSKRHI